MRVLVVDDDSALIRTLGDILRMHGYDASTAATAGEGLRLAASERPALAVVDLRLPDMDGMELVHKLHELSELTQVVVLTGNASVESAIAALREHSVDYLLKPVQVDRLLQVVSVASERWQRVRMEEALRESEERYRMLFDRNPQPVWVHDRETLRFLAVNEAAVRHYGWSRDEFMAMGGGLDAISAPESVPAMLSAARTPADGVPRLFRHHRKDGSAIDVEVTSHDIPFGGRQARVVISNDVTERVAAERAMESRARQQAALADFGQRALGFDDMNRLFDEATHVVADLLDVPVSVVLEYRPDATHTTLRAAYGVEETAAGQQGTVVLRDHGVVSGLTVDIPGPMRAFGALGAHDREPRQFSQDDFHFMQALAQILGTMTERSRAEAAMRQSQRLEAVGRLAGGVAHDFNNMLTAITGYGEMLRAGLPEGDPLREDADEILKAADRAAGLTRQLLAFSRQQVLQARLVSLNDSVRDMEKMLRRLIGEDIEFVTRLDPDLRLAKTDPSQVQQVILNLCVNARDAMPHGGTLTIETANVELDAHAVAEHSITAPGQYVQLAVTDTGVGMDAETKSRLYEPFFTTKPSEKGTGLGLATVYGIVKQSGGEIWVYSEPGHGTTFKVFFPAVSSVGELAVPAARPASSVVGSETILLAEDEDAVRRLAHRVLERAGYTVLLAGSGADAEKLARAHEGTIHLLVTDMVMPGIGGRELAERLRALRPDIRVLYLSGYTDSTVTQKGLLDAGDSFLQKPFTTDALARKVRETIDPSRVSSS